jgi:hypothetical protein
MPLPDGAALDRPDPCDSKKPKSAEALTVEESPGNSSQRQAHPQQADKKHVRLGIVDGGWWRLPPCPVCLPTHPAQRAADLCGKCRSAPGPTSGSNKQPKASSLMVVSRMQRPLTRCFSTVPCGRSVPVYALCDSQGQTVNYEIEPRKVARRSAGGILPLRSGGNTAAAERQATFQRQD